MCLWKTQNRVELHILPALSSIVYKQSTVPSLSRGLPCRSLCESIALPQMYHQHNRGKKTCSPEQVQGLKSNKSSRCLTQAPFYKDNTALNRSAAPSCTNSFPSFKVDLLRFPLQTHWGFGSRSLQGEGAQHRSSAALLPLLIFF